MRIVGLLVITIWALAYFKGLRCRRVIVDIGDKQLAMLYWGNHRAHLSVLVTENSQLCHYNTWSSTLNIKEGFNVYGKGDRSLIAAVGYRWQPGT